MASDNPADMGLETPGAVGLKDVIDAANIPTEYG